MSCCYGWRIRSYATNGRAAPTRNAAPPAVKAGWSRHPKAVVVVLEGRPPRLDLELYPYLPRVRVNTTSAGDYMTLLSGRAA